MVLVERADLVRPDAGCVDHHRRPDVERLAARRCDGGAPHPAGGVGHQTGDRRVVDGGGAVPEDGGPEHRQGEAAVVGPRVPVEESGGQAVGPQGRHVGERLLAGDLLVAAPDPHATGEVVQPQRRPVHAGDALVDHAGLAEQRDEEGERGHEVGGVVEEALTLGEVLVDQSVLVLLEVAQAAVDELRRLRRRTRREVVTFDQCGLQPTAGGVERHAGPRDAAADDQDVEGLRGEAGQGPVACERLGGRCGCGHGESLPHVGGESFRGGGPCRSVSPMIVD